MLFWHHIPWGVDFRGGTLVYVKFAHTPDENAIRAQLWIALACANFKIQRYGAAANNEVLIDLDVRETNEKALDQGKLTIIKALRDQYRPHLPARSTLITPVPDGQELLDGERSAAPGHRRRSEIFGPGAGHRSTIATSCQSGVLNSLDQLKGADWRRSCGRGLDSRRFLSLRLRRPQCRDRRASGRWPAPHPGRPWLPSTLCWGCWCTWASVLSGFTALPRWSPCSTIL